MRARLGNQSIVMPVDGLMFARLKNVIAVPAAANTQGNSLVRIQAVDTMLSRMQGMQGTAHISNAQQTETEVMQKPVQSRTSFIDPYQGISVDMLL
jgi:hypothetical protein